MILELVDIRIQPGQQAEFDAAVQRGLEQVIGKATGYQSHVINKCIETPERYVIQIYWATLEIIPLISAAHLPSWNGAASSAHSSHRHQSSNISTSCRNRPEPFPTGYKKASLLFNRARLF
jgi:heme-degrading monooxygenase HmoA